MRAPSAAAIPRPAALRPFRPGPGPGRAPRPPSPMRPWDAAAIGGEAGGRRAPGQEPSQGPARRPRRGLATGHAARGESAASPRRVSGRDDAPPPGSRLPVGDFGRSTKEGACTGRRSLSAHSEGPCRPDFIPRPGLRPRRPGPARWIISDCEAESGPNRELSAPPVSGSESGNLSVPDPGRG